MEEHLKSLAPRHVDTKFIKLDAEVGNFIFPFAINIETQLSLSTLWLPFTPY
jgi:hypothetical protein